MVICVTDRALVDELCAHFRRAGLTAERVGGSMVAVAGADAPSVDQERREIAAHLQVFRLIHPETDTSAISE
jgi:hypothetical protein